MQIRINGTKPMHSYSTYYESVKMSLKTPEIDKAINIECTCFCLNIELFQMKIQFDL